MKRLTLFAAAVFSAATMFAGVTYELNGGKTNDLGWETPQDMYETLNADWNAFSGTETTWKSLAELNGDIVAGIPTQAGKMDAPFLADANFKAHFGWLIDYMDPLVVGLIDGNGNPLAAASTGSSALRYNLSAFFGDGHRLAWPVGPCYINAGVSRPSEYASYWQAAFANPTEVTETFVLNAPYKAGSLFAGWYATADFSGEQVLTIDATTTGTLYAKWIEGEALTTAAATALADDAAAIIDGTVTQVIGNEFWVEDVTGGILCYQKDHGLVAGDYVVLKGKKVTYGGIAELKEIEVLAKRAVEPFRPVANSVAAIIGKPELVMSEYVSIAGGLVAFGGATKDGYDSVFIADAAGNKILCYKLQLDKALDGAKVDVAAVVGKYNTTLQLRVIADNVALSMAGKPEAYDYPARGENGEFKLTNKWIISNVEDNFAANMPNTATGTVRGMAYKNGKLYFPERANKELVIVDGATGTMLKSVKLADNIFTMETDSTPIATPTTLSFNDIKLDAAGNLLLGSCITSSQVFQIWKVDETTGAGELVVQEKLWDNPDNDSLAYRFDAFGVYGDVDAHAIIMAADAYSMTVFKWTINDGKVDGLAEMIELYVDPEADNSYLISGGAMITSPGTAPQVFPVDDDYFYLDGNATFPTLFNMDGTLADDFKNCEAGLKVGNNEGDTCTLNQGHNGLLEFQIGDDYFILFAATNTVGSPNSAFALYKYANAAKSWADMEPMWYFPVKGMGSAVNGYRTAACGVEVDNSTGLATLAVFTGENGYAVYEFQGVPAKEDGVENVLDNAVKAQKVLRDGQVIIIRNGVEYNVLGSQVK